jgi:uncharacterized protein (TIGR00369 family)
MATTLKINAHRLNFVDHSPLLSCGLKSGIFKPRNSPVPLRRMPSRMRENTCSHVERGNRSLMQYEPQAEDFDIEEARRVLGNVFAPWVQDLGLSVGNIECAPPPGASADWQPGAILRMAFSERLCRHGGIVCGQALMALADTAMVIAILAANRGYRPMTTVDQTTHFMRAVASSDVLADARVVRLGRTMSFGRVTLSSATDNRPVAMVSSAFAML